MRFPAYGKSLWDRRLLGERLRVVLLLVGNRWKIPHEFATDTSIPRLAVKTAPWHLPDAERFDWRLVAACTVMAIDTRGPDERDEGPDGWDPWLWLLADAQTFARDVLRFTITEHFDDLPDAWAPERDLETYAWLSSRYVNGAFTWPAWWPHARRIFDRRQLDEAAA